MRSQTVAYRYGLFVSAAIIAAHASSADEGFRQRDVVFFVELFLNWSERAAVVPSTLQNTQIGRYLEDLAKSGYLRRFPKKPRPLFKVTRVGLLELLTRIVNSETTRAREHVFFVVYFLTAYRDMLESLVEAEGAQFPPAARIELLALLDIREVLSREISRLEKEIAKLDARIESSQLTEQLVRSRLAQYVPFDEVVREVEKKYPYELNSRKPLSELLKQIRPGQRRWELEGGNFLRRETMWIAQRSSLQAHLFVLRRLLSSEASLTRRGVPEV